MFAKKPASLRYNRQVLTRTPIGPYRGESLIIKISMFESNLNKHVLKHSVNFIIPYYFNAKSSIYVKLSFFPVTLVYYMKCGYKEQFSTSKV